MRRDLGEINSLTYSSGSILTKLSEIIGGYFYVVEGSFRTANPSHSDVVPQLKILIDYARKIWRCNMQIMNFMAHLNASAPSPEMRFTWFQEPIRFEDAMGRFIPIPSEYDWGASSPCLTYYLYFLLISPSRHLKLLLWPDSKMDLCKKRYALANTNCLTRWTAHKLFLGLRAKYSHLG